MAETDVPDAELLIAPGCPHCPSVLSTLADLIKQGRIGRLHVINLGLHSEEADPRGARGVPWLRLGPFVLVGAHRPAELAEWVERAASNEGRRAYLLEQLASGELETVIGVCHRAPEMLLPLVDLAADLDTPFAVRIGIAAVFEALGPRGELTDLVEALDRQLGHSEHVQVRADAAYFLGLTGSDAAHSALERLANDADAEVREIAAESTEMLSGDGA